MLKYLNTAVTFSEFPDEISLVIFLVDELMILGVKLGEKESSYISYITDSDEEPSFSLCKEDLVQTARDIKPFHM